MSESLLKRVDHLVYSTTDLEKSILELELRLGVRPAPGGRHLGRGTRNALLALSDTSYLELVGPDPTQPQGSVPRWLEIDSLESPRLVTWAVKEPELHKRVASARAHGVTLGEVVSGSRVGADGSHLQWQFTDPTTLVSDGIVPFFIDWGESPHPASSAPRGLLLVSLRAEHPQRITVMHSLSAVGVELPVEFGPSPSLIATLRTRRGFVELR
jgi:hypothetical protein